MARVASTSRPGRPRTPPPAGRSVITWCRRAAPQRRAQQCTADGRTAFLRRLRDHRYQARCDRLRPYRTALTINHGHSLCINLASTRTRFRKGSHTMKKHLITGGAGFIGSTLAKSLLADGDDVTVVDNLETGSLENLDGARGHERFHFVEGDICDTRLMDELTSKADVVEHLAARIGLQIIIGQAHKTLQTNVKGTEIVLEAAAKYGCRTILASTSEVYGLTERIPS